MPIPKAAVERYLDRRVDSHAWLKKLSASEVEEYLSYLKPRHEFTMPLWLDQKICFLLGVAYPETIMMTDLGLGKTGVSLELLTYFYTNKFIRRAFVFCPTNEVAEGWEDEIKKWGFTIPYIRLTQKSSRDKWDTLIGFKNGIIIGTYIGIAAMVSSLVPATKRTQQREIVPEKINKSLIDVDSVVYDQSTKLGNRVSLSYAVCERFSAASQIRFSLAGRAFGRDAFILWAQFFLTDRGRALGDSPGMFREAFWRREETGYGKKWVRRVRREEDLSRFIAASSIRYSVDEARELPKRIPPIIKRCSLAEESIAYYERFRDELIQSRGNYREVKNAFLRMRQISSGFVGFIDDDTGERAQIEFDVNPKLDMLMDHLSQVPENRKAIIVHEFNWSGSRICQELAREKYKFGWLWGGTKDWTSIKDGLNNDPEFRVLVASHKKAAMGLNLQSANYMMIYESPVSAIDRYELEGRIRRTGQKHRCFYYDLVVRDTVDEAILSFHKEGNDLWRDLVENPAAYV